MVLSDMERGLFELPAIYGGRGIINPSKISDRENRNSQILTQEESRLIKNQHLISDVNKDKLKEIKNGIKCEKSRQYQDSLTKIKQIPENDRSQLTLLVSSREPAAYNWFTTIPLMEHDFYLNKTFRNSNRIRYNKQLKYFTINMYLWSDFQFRICPFL